MTTVDDTSRPPRPPSAPALPHRIPSKPDHSSCVIMTTDYLLREGASIQRLAAGDRFVMPHDGSRLITVTESPTRCDGLSGFVKVGIDLDEAPFLVPSSFLVRPVRMVRRYRFECQGCGGTEHQEIDIAVYGEPASYLCRRCLSTPPRPGDHQTAAAT